MTDSADQGTEFLGHPEVISAYGIKVPTFYRLSEHAGYQHLESERVSASDGSESNRFEMIISVAPWQINQAWPLVADIVTVTHPPTAGELAEATIKGQTLHSTPPVPTIQVALPDTFPCLGTPEAPQHGRSIVLSSTQHNRDDWQRLTIKIETALAMAEIKPGPTPAGTKRILGSGYSNSAQQAMARMLDASQAYYHPNVRRQKPEDRRKGDRRERTPLSAQSRLGRRQIGRRRGCILIPR